MLYRFLRDLTIREYPLMCNNCGSFNEVGRTSIMITEHDKRWMCSHCGVHHIYKELPYPLEIKHFKEVVYGK